MKLKVLNLDAKSAGEIELKDEIFGLEPRSDLIQRVIVWQLAKRRAGTHKTKTRGEINRTTKKWYRQKGTGSARHGARSAPLFVGGGKAMAPVVRSHEFDLPKKVRAAGMLIVDGEFDKNFAMSARNLANVALVPASGLNVYDIIKHDTLVMTKAAVSAIEERLS